MAQTSMMTPELMQDHKSQDPSRRTTAPAIIKMIIARNKAITKEARTVKEETRTSTASQSDRIKMDFDKTLRDMGNHQIKETIKTATMTASFKSSKTGDLATDSQDQFHMEPNSSSTDQDQDPMRQWINSIKPTMNEL